MKIKVDLVFKTQSSTMIVRSIRPRKSSTYGLMWTCEILKGAYQGIRKGEQAELATRQINKFIKNQNT